MPKPASIIALLALTICISCKKEFSGWSVYYKSLIDMENTGPGKECPEGGLMIKTGLDKNQNDKLDSNEVDQVKTVCNGVAGDSGLIFTIPFRVKRSVSG